MFSPVLFILIWLFFFFLIAAPIIPWNKILLAIPTLKYFYCFIHGNIFFLIGRERYCGKIFSSSHTKITTICLFIHFALTRLPPGQLLSYFDVSLKLITKIGWVFFQFVMLFWLIWISFPSHSCWISSSHEYGIFDCASTVHTLTVALCKRVTVCSEKTNVFVLLYLHSDYTVWGVVASRCSSWHHS